MVCHSKSQQTSKRLATTFKPGQKFTCIYWGLWSLLYIYILQKLLVETFSQVLHVIFIYVCLCYRNWYKPSLVVRVTGPWCRPDLALVMLFSLICFPSCEQSTVGKDGAVMGVTVTRMSMNLHTQVLSQACSYTEGRCLLKLLAGLKNLYSPQWPL